jgi:hypothetical protein
MIRIRFSVWICFTRELKEFSSALFLRYRILVYLWNIFHFVFPPQQKLGGKDKGAIVALIKNKRLVNNES